MGIKAFIIRIKIFIAIVLLISFAIAAPVIINPTILKAGDRLPESDLTGLTNLKISTSAFKYPLILFVFNTKCTVCKEEEAILNSIYTDSKINHVALYVLGIDTGESINKVSSYQQKQKLEYPLLVDSKHALIKKLQINSTPVVLIFNKYGALVYQGNRLPDEWKKHVQ